MPDTHTYPPLPETPEFDAAAAASVEAAILSRRSVRAFTDEPVPRAVIERLLALGGRSPSGTNIQPWRVYAFTGEALEAVTQAMVVAFNTEEGAHKREYKYYTDEFFEPFLARRRACGWGLYSLLGIGRGDREKSRAYRLQNYEFFGAPVGLIFTIDRRLEIGSWLDYGMFLQTLMVGARAFGLHTCPEASVADYHRILRAHAPIDEGEMVVCGMAVGYAQPEALVNGFQPARIPVAEFTTFIG